LRLKSIELQGFKSFAERTRLDFDDGITAILGPNGCGKSNVVDAVRWVLGEQSAKQLRGGKMDDIIFKGSTKRRPVGMAEVTLVFENEDRGLPIDFSEVAVKRRVTRDGGSDYFLNGSPCRLRDLRDLFYDSGVNNTSYSIIEESMIKQILNENNTELRTLLEEGSGITKYKARRKETQRKLDRTRTDLTRLYDIVEEIGREVRSLQRQVGKARRHQKLFREIRGLDLLLAGRRHAALDREEDAARERLSEFRTQAEAGVGELAELQAKVAAARPQVDEREDERRQLEEALQAFAEELQETERQVLVLQHRSEENARRVEDNTRAAAEAHTRQEELEGRIGRLGVHLARIGEERTAAQRQLAERSESLRVLDDRLAHDRTALDEATRLNLEVIESDASRRSQLRELQVKQENRRERVAILETEREELLRAGREAEQQLTDLRTEREEALAKRRELLAELADREREETELEAASTAFQEGLATAHARAEAARSTRDLLQGLQEDYEGYGQGPRELLKRHGGENRVTGGVVDQIHVPAADRTALEALLAELLDAVVVDGPDTALQLVDELRGERLGRASFLCGDGFDTDGEAIDLTAAGGRPAAGVITGPGAELPALRRLLVRTVIFDDDAAAVAAARGWNGADVLTCVSRAGLLVRSDGTMRGGAGETGENGLLGRKEQLERLAEELIGLEQQETRAQKKLAVNRERRETAREALIEGRGRLSTLDEELGRQEVVLARTEHTRGTASQRAGEMAAEQNRLTGEVDALVAEEETLTDVLSASGRERQDSTTRREDLREQVQEGELVRDEARAGVEELRLTLQKRESEQREGEAALEHLRDNVAELFARRERLAEESELARETIAVLDEELTAKREVLGKSMEERTRRRQVVRAAAEGIQNLHEEMAVWNDRVQAIEKQRGGFRDQAHEMETLLATLDVRRNNLEERIEEQHKGSFQDLVDSVNEDDLPKELEMDEGVFQAEQAEELLELKRTKLGSLGPINHLALEEYETKKERLDFLEQQRDDVEKARDDLEQAITGINRTARKRFVQTFEEVRRNYVAVFQTLFKGGRADIQLIRTDDPLESHIRIIAQPTGKVVDHVSLLSGGERCLTALSLLFAVYLVKPSPFCMLDEADAPLDDANIQRFVNMLREFSRNTQFLVITHNKLTMETANHLYGVTMMEPGCSSIVSVSFHDVAETQSDTELAGAIAARRRKVDQREEVRAQETLALEAEETVVETIEADEADDGDEAAAADPVRETPAGAGELEASE